jgi:hypothetical protein
VVTNPALESLVVLYSVLFKARTSTQVEVFTLLLCRMVQMRAAGLTAIQTYVEWSSHQPEPNQASDTLLYALLTFKRNLCVFRGGLPVVK